MVTTRYQIRRPHWVHVFTDSLVLSRRSTIHVIRSTDQLLGLVLQPLMFLILFATVFGSSIAKSLPPATDYFSFLLPGIIVWTLPFGSGTTAIAINRDFSEGILDRFRSMPMNSLAVLIGHVTSDLFRNGISSVTLIVAGLVAGWRFSTSLVDMLLLIGLLVLFTLTFSWLAALIGILAGSVESVQWILFVVFFPLTFVSTAFVPVDSLPKALQGFAQNQPVSQVVDTVRAIFLAQPIDNHAVSAVVWCVGILAIAIPVSAYLFRRKNTS